MVSQFNEGKGEVPGAPAEKRILVKTYLFFLLIPPLLVTFLAVIQHIVVLKYEFSQLRPFMFIVPNVVGLVFGFLLARLRLLRKRSDVQVELLHNQDRELSDLNKNLEKKVNERNRQLLETHNLTRNVLDSTENIVILTNGREIQNANLAFFRFFDEYRSLEEFNYDHGCVSDFFNTDRGEDYIEKNLLGNPWMVTIARNPERRYQALIVRSGENHIFDVRARSLETEKETLYVATLSDVTELMEYRNRLEVYSEKLSRRLYYDELTGLPNRTRLLADLKKIANPSLILVNIDSFKTINNYFGHGTGDRILILTAERIGGTLDDQATTLYRLSADEFAVLIMEREGAEDPEPFMVRLLGAITGEAFPGAGGTEILVQATAGAATTAGAGGEFLLNAANIALRLARRDRADFKIYSPLMAEKKEYESNIAAIRLLNAAIREDRIGFFIQPIQNNKTGKIEKFECLARLHLPDGTVVPPAGFLQAAKTARLYPHITRRVVEQACRAFQGLPHSFSLNISIDDMMNQETVDFIFQTIDRHNTGPQMIFEILESESMETFPEIERFVKRIRSLGCGIAIDDFGSGYSNFDFILKLRADYLKIDATLIRNVDVDRNSRIIVETIQDFASRLGIRTTGEYVHSEAVHRTVCEIGLDYSQGYFIGQPDRPEAFFPG